MWEMAETDTQAWQSANISFDQVRRRFPEVERLVAGYRSQRARARPAWKGVCEDFQQSFNIESSILVSVDQVLSWLEELIGNTYLKR